jgi:hypothetical protein
MDSQVKKSDWDLDLRFGQEGEVFVNKLLTSPIETIEVKRDRKWSRTGNFYIEVECWSNNNQSWYLSGINTTKATHQAFLLHDSVLIFPTERIKETVRLHGAKVECSIPPNFSRGFLITPEQILRMTAQSEIRGVAQQ